MVTMAWPGVTWREVQANGITFEVATAGPEQTGVSPRLALCLHGFPEHAYSWRYQVPLLVELGYQVWAPNLRGYGNTEAPRRMSAYSLDTLVADVVALIEACLSAHGGSTVLLLAHDWGGMLAWLVATHHPELLERLIVCNMPHPACFAREVRRREQFLRSWYVLFFQLPQFPERLLGARGARRIAEMFRLPESSNAIPEEAREVYRQNASRPGRLTAMLHWYRALLRGGGWRDLPKAGAWPKIEVPTLLLWGDADTALSVRTTDGTAAFVSNLTLRVFPSVSHWVQQEAHAAVNAEILTWLDTTNPAAHTTFA